MAQAKTKVSVAQSKKKKTKLKVKSKSAPTIMQSSVWREEIKALQARRFASLEEAQTVFIDQVLNRLSSQGTEEREFLTLLLSTDPAFTELLKRALKFS